MCLLKKKVDTLLGDLLKKLGFQKYDQYRGSVAYSCEYLKIRFSHNDRFEENDVFLIPLLGQDPPLFTLHDYVGYLAEKGMVSNSMNESSSIDEYLHNAFKLLAMPTTMWFGNPKPHQSAQSGFGIVPNHFRLGI